MKANLSKNEETKISSNAKKSVVKKRATKSTVSNDSVKLEEPKAVKKRGRPSKKAVEEIKRPCVTLTKVLVKNKVFNLDSGGDKVVAGVTCKKNVFRSYQNDVKIPIVDINTQDMFNFLMSNVFKHLVYTMKKNKKCYNNQTFTSKLMTLDNVEFINMQPVETGIDAYFESLNECCSDMVDFLTYLFDKYTLAPSLETKATLDYLKSLNKNLKDNLNHELKFEQNKLSAGCISIRFPTGNIEKTQKGEEFKLEELKLGNKMVLTLELFKKYSNPKYKGFKSLYQNTFAFVFVMDDKEEDFVNYIERFISKPLVAFMKDFFSKPITNKSSVPTLMTIAHRDPEVEVVPVGSFESYPSNDVTIDKMLEAINNEEQKKLEEREEKRKEYSTNKDSDVGVQETNFKDEYVKVKTTKDNQANVVILTTILDRKNAYRHQYYIDGQQVPLDSYIRTAKDYECPYVSEPFDVYKEIDNVFSKPLLSAVSEEEFSKHLQTTLMFIEKLAKSAADKKKFNSIVHQDLRSLLYKEESKPEMSHNEEPKNNPVKNLADMILGDSEEETFQITFKRVKK